MKYNLYCKANKDTIRLQKPKFWYLLQEPDLRHMDQESIIKFA